MIVIGIDPGLTGAIAILGKRPEVVDMPVMTKVTGKGKQVNPYALVDVLDHLSARVYIERVTSMPGQGVTSMFSFGHSAGIIEGVAASEGHVVHFVQPGAWKRYHGLIGKDKDAARTLAIQKYPILAGQLARKKDVGRADALLIAEYGLHLERKA